MRKLTLSAIILLLAGSLFAQIPTDDAAREYDQWRKSDAGKKALEEMTSAKSRLQLRLVLQENEKGEADEFEDKSEGKIRVSRQVLLNEKAVARAYATPTQDGRTAVGANLTKDGGMQMHWITSQNLNRKLAIVFDGKLITAPVIRSPIRDALVITTGADFGAEARDQMIKALNAGKDSK